MYYVYALIDPVSRTPFYIGKGKEDRMYAHFKKSQNSNRRKLDRIAIIREIGHEPYPEKIIDGIENEIEAYETEELFIEWCRKYYSEQFTLTNFDGSKRPKNTWKGKHLPDYVKAKLAKSHKKLWNTDNIDILKLRELYIVQNKTKNEVCQMMGIGVGTMNRLLVENSIKKELKLLIPPKENLENLFNHSLHAIARHYSTSIPTVKKWLRSYGIQHPREYSV